MLDIYQATPIPIGSEPKRKSVWYHIWWLIRGNMTIKKQILRTWFCRKKIKSTYSTYQQVDLNEKEQANR